MTQYFHKVAFSDIEVIEIENLVKEAINKFKQKHKDDGLPLPWVWESILSKLTSAETSLMSQSSFVRE